MPVSPRTLLLVALAAFALRLGFTLAYRGSLSDPPRQAVAGADSVEYDQLARSLAAGQGYCWPDGRPTAFRAPGFPIALAAVDLATKGSYAANYLTLAAFGAIGTLMAFGLAKELLGDSRFGLTAAIIAAIYPPDVYACSYFFSEALFAPLLGAGLWLLAIHVRKGTFGFAVAAGLLLGFAALTRSFAVLLLPTFGSYLFAVRGLRSSLIFAIAFAVVILPWTLRNYEVFGEPVLIATNGGSTFYGANNELTAGSLPQHGNWIATNHLPGRDLIDAQPDEVSHDRMEWRLGIDWVKEHPGSFAKLLPFKVIRFWLPFVQWPSLKVYPLANIAGTLPFLIMIWLGLAISLRRRRYAILHLTLAANLVMVLIFWGDPRFRDANVPVLAVYATLGWQRLRRRPVP